MFVLFVCLFVLFCFVLFCFVLFCFVCFFVSLFVCCFLCFAEVPCAVAVRTAKAVTEEIPEAASSSLGRLARIREKNAERDVHRVSTRYQLTLPLQLSDLKVGHHTIKYLRMSAWATFLLGRNLWHHLAGLETPDSQKCQETWSLFWRRFRVLRPDHEIFHRPGFDYSRCCALLLHGDEGRSLRKSAILILAAHSILGYGIRTSCKTSNTESHRLNYVKSTWVTRFLLGVLPKSLYSMGDDIDDFQDEECESDELDSDVYEGLLKVIAEDLRDLFDTGLVNPLDQQRYFFCCINVMGDWPFLQRAGHLNRSFYNAAKHAASKSEPKGICHRCLGDRLGFPWEDFESERPAWVLSQNTISPFSARPSLLLLPHIHNDPSELFAWDVFHTWHLGCGKTFLGTAIVLLAMSSVFDGGVEARLGALTIRFQAWCQRQNLKPHIRRFTRENLSWKTSNSYPSGVWSKGHTTRVLNKWFLAECEAHKEETESNVLLGLAHKCSVSIEKFLQGMYRHELWIPTQTARELGFHGLSFLRWYGRGVNTSYHESSRFFQLMPNLHRLHHIALSMVDDSDLAGPRGFILNPLAFGCQPEEDYIGRPSRVSRRVSPKLVVQRTLQRCLVAAHAAFRDAGLLLGD